MLMSVEMKPMTPAAISGQGRGGSSSAMRQSSRPSAILSETRPAAITHTHLRNVPLEAFAVRMPTTTPRTIQGATRFSSARSTEPLARCPANDLSEVGRMMASVVPSTMCMRIAGSTSRMRNTS